MFDRIVLKRSENNDPVSFGQIAEALVFYKNVQLVLDRGSILELVNKIGIETFFKILELDRVSALYIQEHLGVMTQRVGFSDRFGVVAFSLEGREPKQLSRKDRTAEVFARAGCDRRAAAQYADRFLRAVRVKSLTSNDLIPGGVAKAAEADLEDGIFMGAALKKVLQRLAPKYACPEQIEFEVFHYSDHFQVSTNIDFVALRVATGSSEPSIESLMAKIVSARADLALAAYYGCDFSTSAEASEIVRVKSADVLRRSGINAAELAVFRDVVLEDLPAISEVLDAGHKSPEDFFRLLDSSTRFASWASDLSPDEKLVAEYFRAVTSPGWIGSIKSKGVRFVIGTAMGAVEPISAAVLSFADSFLVDRMLGGWRPSHFIEGKLKPFLSP